MKSIGQIIENEAKLQQCPETRKIDCDGPTYNDHVLHPSFHTQPKAFRTDILKSAPFFYYNDYSREVDCDPDTNNELVRDDWAGNFPLKLHAILERKDLIDAAAWMPHGRSFRISNPRDFEGRALTKYFSHGKFSLFIRQLKAWGFRRITSNGPDRSSYYHEMFLRGLPHLAKRMNCHQERIPDIPAQFEPRFREISEEFPLPEKNIGKWVSNALDGECGKPAGSRVKYEKTSPEPSTSPNVDDIFSSFSINSTNEKFDASTERKSNRLENHESQTAKRRKRTSCDDVAEITSCAEAGDRTRPNSSNKSLDLLSNILRPNDQVYAEAPFPPPASFDFSDAGLARYAPHSFVNVSPVTDLHALVTNLLQDKSVPEIVSTVVTPLAARLSSAEDVIRKKDEQIVKLERLLVQILGERSLPLMAAREI